MNITNSARIAIGERIRSLREQQNITQEDLAHRLHVQRESISKWERGIQDIKTEYTVALAAALNTNCDYLLTGVSTENIDFCKESGLSERTLNNLFRVKEIYGKMPELSEAVELLVNGLLSDPILPEIAILYKHYKKAISIEMEHIEQLSLDDVLDHFRQRTNPMPNNQYTKQVKQSYFYLMNYLQYALSDERYIQMKSDGVRKL